MKKVLGILLLSLTLGFSASPALADHGYYDDNCEYGGCGEREEEYGDNSCKYVCPAFDDSPVHDAFNFAPQICLPGATCHFEDRNPDEQRQGEPQR